jgi:membrane protease YdiL (CAAX protease family)
MPEAVKELVRNHRGYALVIAVLLVAYPLLLPEPKAHLDVLFVFINLAFVSLLVLWAVKGMGLTFSEMGMSRSNLGRGLLWGGLVGLTAPLVAWGLMNWSLVTQLPWWSDVGLTYPDLVYRVVFRIPVGTAAFEEIAFRGVLFALLIREGARKAIWLSSASFAIYHIGLVLRVMSSNGITTVSLVQFIILAVVGVGITFIWGLAFALVRYKGRHIAGSILTHWMAYASANVLAFVLSSS